MTVRPGEPPLVILEERFRRAVCDGALSGSASRCVSLPIYAHFHTPHFTEFFGALGTVIAEPPVGTVSEASSTTTLDDAFAAAGIGG
jgi:hypothetical protein